MSEITDTKEHQDRHERLKQVTIYVNTRPYEVERGEISFEEVVKIAYPTPPYGEYTDYSVMYEFGRGGREGTLIAGQSVKVKRFMRFDVTATDRS